MPRSSREIHHGEARFITKLPTDPSSLKHEDHLVAAAGIVCGLLSLFLMTSIKERLVAVEIMILAALAQYLAERIVRFMIKDLDHKKVITFLGLTYVQIGLFHDSEHAQPSGPLFMANVLILLASLVVFFVQFYGDRSINLAAWLRARLEALTASWTMPSQAGLSSARSRNVVQPARLLVAFSASGVAKPGRSVLKAPPWIGARTSKPVAFLRGRLPACVVQTYSWSCS